MPKPAASRSDPSRPERDASAQIPPGTPLGNRILKVNHAGEHGAVCIYAGQLLVAHLTARALRADLRAFKAHELRHRGIFATELARREHPRCRSWWLCAIGGWVLGVLTGLFGRQAILATTFAVERVVLRHLDEQLRVLDGSDPAAVAAIRAIVDDERAHHDHAREELDPGSLWTRLLTPVVSASTEAVIWMGMRF